MNEPTDPSTSQPGPDSFAADPAPPTRSLSAALVEDGEAVQNHLQEVNELAGTLEAQLAGKSKEVLHLKFLLDQTKASFGHLQDSVVAMRKDRHKLANDSMRAQGLELMVTRLTAERDRMKRELDGLLAALAAEKVEQAPQGLGFDKRDRMIAELKLELMGLRKEVAELRRVNPPPAPAAPGPPPKSMPSETLTTEETCVPADLEIVPAEQVLGMRSKR